MSAAIVNKFMRMMGIGENDEEHQSAFFFLNFFL